MNPLDQTDDFECDSGNLYTKIKEDSMLGNTLTYSNSYGPGAISD